MNYFNNAHLYCSLHSLSAKYNKHHFKHTNTQLSLIPKHMTGNVTINILAAKTYNNKKGTHLALKFVHGNLVYWSHANKPSS